MKKSCLYLLLLLLFFSGCGKDTVFDTIPTETRPSPKSSPFQLEHSKRGVVEFLNILGYRKPMYDYEDYYNITPVEIEKEYGFSIYKSDSLYYTYLVYEDAYYPLCEWFGGFGVTSLYANDLNDDSFPELYFTCSWGSGHHRSHVGYFDSASREVITFVSEISNTDAFLYYDSGLKVFQADYKADNTLDFNTVTEAGQLCSSEGNITFVRKDGITSAHQVYSRGFPAGGCYSLDAFGSIVVGKSTWDDIYAIAPVPYSVQANNGTTIEIALDNGNHLFIVFSHEDGTVVSMTEI